MMTMAILSVSFVHSPGRIAVPLTAFGSVVSFLFVAANSVPVLPYATRLDRFFLLCFYVAWIIFLFNVTSFVFGERIKKFKAEAAKRRAPLKSATSLEEVTVSLPPPAPVTKTKATSAFGVGQWERHRGPPSRMLEPRATLIAPLQSWSLRPTATI